MRAIAVTVAIALLIAPVACALVICEIAAPHDCCPKSKSFAACPFDILSSAKSAPATVAEVPVEAAAFFLIGFEPSFAHSVVVDGSNLHIQNRVLRI
jgi:hypothetical protein